MNYRIKRGDQEFGPYSLAELKQYIAEGRIIPTDMAKSEGMDEWTPVLDAMGDVEFPQATSQPAAADLSISSGDSTPSLPRVPPPPGLHWALVLLLSVVTCGIFMLVWMVSQAAWTRKIDPGNKSMVLFCIYIAIVFCSALLGGLSAAMEIEELESLSDLISLVGVVCAIVGYFKIKAAIEDHFGGPPMHLRLSGVLTFFFNVFYIQYYFTKIHGAYAASTQPL